MAKKDRTLYVLKYLWKNTDEDHPATVSDILSALEAENIKVERHALMSDIEQLTEFGIDIVCVKSSPNRYFIGQRSFELPELKLLVDAVESSRFISATQSGSLVSKLYDMASVHQASELNRHLYVDGRVKSDSRTLRCPVCGFRLEEIYELTSGYVQVKCRKCKLEEPLNLAYFRRLKRNILLINPYIVRKAKKGVRL